MNKEQFIHYLAGFADGEGCFCIAIKNQKSAKVRWVLDPVFHVTQHAKSKNILYSFQRILNCGTVIKKYGQPDTSQFIVQSRRELIDKVIPFFRKYKLITKKKDFETFDIKKMIMICCFSVSFFNRADIPFRTIGDFNNKLFTYLPEHPDKSVSIWNVF